MRRLNELYDSGGRAFRVERVAGGYQLLSRRKLANWIRRLGHVPGEVRLSVPAMETLAVVAYRQPALRADIEAIRGVSCGEILRQLMDRDLVRIGGRSEELGRPYLYTTTKNFLRLFGLDTLDSLPRVETMKTAEQETAVLSTESASGEESIDGIEKVPIEEESGMPVLTLSGLELDECQDAADGEKLVEVEMASVDDDDQYDEDEFDEYEEDDDEEDDDEDYDDVDLDDDEDYDDEDEDYDEMDDDEEFEDDWEEVEDEDEDWDEDDEETDWGYEDEDEDEDEDDEWD
jgi:segregation and condensation protein B